jgi:hypothetical protein
MSSGRTDASVSSVIACSSSRRPRTTPCDPLGPWLEATGSLKVFALPVVSVTVADISIWSSQVLQMAGTGMACSNASLSAWLKWSQSGRIYGVDEDGVASAQCLGRVIHAQTIAGR